MGRHLNKPKKGLSQNGFLCDDSAWPLRSIGRPQPTTALLRAFAHKDPA